jgi:hypothetical protein
VRIDSCEPTQPAKILVTSTNGPLRVGLREGENVYHESKQDSSGICPAASNTVSRSETGAYSPPTNAPCAAHPRKHDRTKEQMYQPSPLTRCFSGGCHKGELTNMEDPRCTDCGHPRSEHEEEPPYYCYGEGFCECRGFSYAPDGAWARLQRVKSVTAS